MKLIKFFVLSLAVMSIVFACKAKTETGQIKTEAPAYGTEQAKAPAYGKAEVYLPSAAPEATRGDPARGKVLFNDTAFGSGTSGLSCNSCHPGGKGLENAGDKTEFSVMDMKQSSLEEAINVCIRFPLKGKDIDVKGKDMKDIVAYIRSLKR